VEPKVVLAAALAGVEARRGLHKEEAAAGEETGQTHGDGDDRIVVGCIPRVVTADNNNATANCFESALPMSELQLHVGVLTVWSAASTGPLAKFVLLLVNVAVRKR